VSIIKPDLSVEYECHFSAIDAPLAAKVISATMGKWTIKPIWTILLLVVLVTIGLIQVLPQVDLPDTAFHEDTAPVVTKFRATSAPALPVAAGLVQLSLFNLVSEYLWEHFPEPTKFASANFVTILNCSLLC
jgi:hypothetical protein